MNKKLIIFTFILGLAIGGLGTLFLCQKKYANYDQYEVLRQAIKDGEVKSVLTLLPKNINAPIDRALDTPLIEASFTGQNEVVKALIAKGASLKSKDSDGITPLMAATLEGHLETVKLLVEAGAAFNARVGLQYSKENPPGSIKKPFSQHLLVDINDKNKHGYNALAIAAGYCQSPIVTFLLEHGATVETKTPNGLTPLMLAAHSQCEAAVKTLLEHGADINAVNDNGETALSFAAERRNENLVRYLIEQGAHIDSTMINKLVLTINRTPKNHHTNESIKKLKSIVNLLKKEKRKDTKGLYYWHLETD